MLGPRGNLWVMGWSLAFLAAVLVVADPAEYRPTTFTTSVVLAGFTLWALLARGSVGGSDGAHPAPEHIDVGETNQQAGH